MKAQPFPPLFLEGAPSPPPTACPRHIPWQVLFSQFSSPSYQVWVCLSGTLLNLGEQEENWRISRQPSSLTSSSSSESRWWYRSERAASDTGQSPQRLLLTQTDLRRAWRSCSPNAKVQGTQVFLEKKTGRSPAPPHQWPYCQSSWCHPLTPIEE